MGGALGVPRENTDELMALMSVADKTNRGGDLIKPDVYKMTFLK